MPMPASTCCTGVFRKIKKILFPKFKIMLKNATQIENVRKALALVGKTLPTISVNILRVSELSDDDDDSKDEWDAEVTTYEYDTSELARSEDKKPTAPAWREPVNRIIKRKVETDKKFATAPKTPRFGNHQAPIVTKIKDTELIKVPRMQNIEDLSLNLMLAKKVEFMTPEKPVTDSEEEMKDLPESKKELRLSKKFSEGKVLSHAKNPLSNEVNMRFTLEKMVRDRLVQTANKEFNLDVIQKRFLRTSVPKGDGLTNENLIVGLSMFKSVMKAMAKKGENISTYKIASIGVKDSKIRKAYMRSTPKTKVQIAKSARYKTLFDTEAEVNIMTHDIVVAEGLPMRSYPDVNLVSYNEDRRSFFEICEDVEITIGGVTGHHHVFVIEATNHQLIFGQPFLLQMRVQLVYKRNDVKQISREGTLSPFD